MRIKVIKEYISACKSCDHAIHIHTTGYMDRLGTHIDMGGVVLGKWYCDLARRMDAQERGLVHFPIDDPDDIADICPLDDD